MQVCLDKMNFHVPGMDREIHKSERNDSNFLRVLRVLNAMLMNTLRISLFIRFVVFFNFLLKFNFCIFSVLVLTENQMTRSQTVHPTSATCNTDAKNHCDRDNFVWWIIASATYCREDKRSLYIWPCFILTLIFFSTRLKLISLWLPFLICSQDQLKERATFLCDWQRSRTSS